MDKKVSCIIVDDEPVAREILHDHLLKIEQIQVVGLCAGAMGAFNLISTQQVDLIFLDINMPEISGLSFAKSINKNIKIIFTTAYRDYAIEGFDLQAVDYLLKPISFERLLQSVNLYFEVHRSNDSTVEENDTLLSNNFMFVRADRKMVKIDFSDIVFIESISDYVKVHRTTDTVITRDTIGNIEAKLPPQTFIRVHRSFIISMPKIISYTSEYIEIKGRTVPIGRTHKSFVLDRLERG